MLFSYLVVQLIFFSTDFKYALDNFVSEWMKLILFSVIGAGSGLLMCKSEPRKLILFFAVAFAVPLLIHLGLFVVEGFKIDRIPWAYRGIADHQNLLGYTALHATLFSGIFLFFHANNIQEKSLAFLLITAGLASPFIAATRAGTAFALMALFSVFLVAFLSTGHGSRLGHVSKIFWGIVMVILLISAERLGSTVYDENWSKITGRFELGFLGDPLAGACEDTAAIRKELEKDGEAKSAGAASTLQAIAANDGDIARVRAARAAVRLSLANPMGIDQSRDAYRIALRKICSPKFILAHAHNGWLDTALAIGIPGAILYLLVLLNFTRLGLSHIRESDDCQTAAVALFALSAIWILRGLVDSTQRNQMLEMQIFTICFFYGFLVARKNRSTVLVKSPAT